MIEKLMFEEVSIDECRKSYVARLEIIRMLLIMIVLNTLMSKTPFI